MCKKDRCIILCYSLACMLILPLFNTYAVDRVLVWADEFDGPSINEKYWSYEIGPTNDNIHYYTNRTQNAEIVDGVLQIRALKETYEGYEYTAAHLSTKNSVAWKYARVEARIKLPGTKGFVPAFWMLPMDSRYGWWPYSGEIDIMEYPSNEEVNIYGTVHTEAYNLFLGNDLPQGDHTVIADADDAFHIYAIEWTPEKIDFYVDNNLYYSYTNDGGDTDTWPFNQPFYLIMNVAVGGGWVGDPDETTVFPAIMEIDYVRVYQHPEDMALNGSDYATPDAPSQWYFAPETSASDFLWSVPNRAEIVSRAGTAELEVNWDIFGGFIELETSNGIMTYPVEITNNLFKNGSFEKGIKYWNSVIQYPVEGNFTLTNNDQADGDYGVYINVSAPGNNPWDVQLAQENIPIKSGSSYTFSFQAKAIDGNGEIAAAFIHPTNFSVYAQESFTLTGEWKTYTYNFNASATINALFTIDMGDHSGSYYFDDFKITPSTQPILNQVSNASFEAETDDWEITSVPPASAVFSVEQGEAHIQINQAGANPGDIFFGQSGFTFEQGTKYEISFEARTSEEHNISLIAGMNAAPWTVYSTEHTFSVNERRSSYSFTFTMEDATDTDARIGFNLGNAQGDVIIDNVYLSPNDSDQPTQVSNHSSNEIENLISIYPNPVESNTIINYHIKEENYIKIEFYASDGRLIENIFNGYANPGDYKVAWNRKLNPDGIYYMVIISGDTKSIQKLILH